MNRSSLSPFIIFLFLFSAEDQVQGCKKSTLPLNQILSPWVSGVGSHYVDQDGLRFTTHLLGFLNAGVTVWFTFPTQVKS